MSARSIHPFPARMAPEIALDAIPQRSTAGILTVIDPMCGSGTVLSAAINRGQRAIGVDIDPLAVLMSKVATAPLDVDDFRTISAAVLERAQRTAGVAPWKDDETERFVRFWFGENQRRDLISLAASISSVDDHDVRAALQVALSRIIITKSPQASLAADTSHSRPHRTTTASSYDVFAGFTRSVGSLSRLLEARAVTGSAEVSRGDSRSLKGIADSSVDIAVTSPPYLNALDYMRGHKMALVWFGYSIRDLRELRSTSIGAERAPDSPPEAEVEELVSFIENDVVDNTKLPRGTLQRFAGDMVGLGSALGRVVKAGGHAIMVVGNSTLRGNYIRNDLIVQRALEDSGFTLENRSEREIPATSRYMAINTSSSSSTISNRMRSEIVITMTRAS